MCESCALDCSRASLITPCNQTGREVGGHWSSGLPYLQSALKTEWMPMRHPTHTLQGVQLLLDYIDVLPLQVTASRAAHAPVSACITQGCIGS